MSITQVLWHFKKGHHDCLQVLWTEYLQERLGLVNAMCKDRKMSNLPKITQVSLS